MSLLVNILANSYYAYITSLVFLRIICPLCSKFIVATYSIIICKNYASMIIKTQLHIKALIIGQNCGPAL